MCIVMSAQLHRATRNKYSRAQNYAAIATSAYAAFLAPAKNSALGDFQSMEAPKMRVSSDKTRNQVLKTGQEGKVCQVGANFGYLELSNGERVFFYESQLIGGGIREVQRGAVMRFDVVFNPTSKKFLAEHVKQVEAAPVEREVRQSGHFLDMEPVRFVSKPVAVENVHVGLAEGYVAELNRDYGFLNVDGERVFFHESQLCSLALSDLRVGISLRFRVVFNQKSQRKIAQEIKAPVQVRSTTQLGNFLDVQQNSFVPKAPVPETVHVSGQVEGYVAEIHQGYGFLNVDGERVFFHESQLVRLAMQNLRVGTSLQFRVVFNQKRQRKIAQEVKAPEEVRSTTQVGNFLDMQQTSVVPKAPLPETIHVSGLVEGYVAELQKDYGFLNVDGERVFFHESQLVCLAMQNLRVGTALQFRVVFNQKSQTKIAQEIKTTETLQKSPSLGNLLDMQVTAPVVTAPEPSIVSICKAAVQGRVVEVKRDYGFMEISDGSLRSSRVFFHHSNLISCSMEDIRVGSTLQCSVAFNRFSKQRVAQEIRLVEEDNESMTDSVEEEAPLFNFLQVDGGKMLRRLSQQILINVEEVEGGELAKSLLSIRPADILRKDSISMLVDVLSGRNSRVNSRINSRAASRRGSIV